MHEWSVTPKEAVEIQKRLRSEVVLAPLPGTPKTVGGCDVSMARFASRGFAGFVTLSYPALERIDQSSYAGTIPFPYIPGLLSFREVPLLREAWEKLEKKPDVLIVDGVGIAHPRRLGIASHLGLVLDVPTVGCAKSVLTGTYAEPPEDPGTFSPLYNKGEVIGAALRTKMNVKPVFVSPGHRITLEQSVALVYACVIKHRLLEATRQAHLYVNEERVREG